MATKTLVLTLRSILRHYGNHVNVFPHVHHYPILFRYCLWHSEDYIKCKKPRKHHVSSCATLPCPFDQHFIRSLCYCNHILQAPNFSNALSFSSEILINETTSITQSQFHGLIQGDLITCKLVSLGLIIIRRVSRCNYLLVISPYQVHMCVQTPQVSLLGSLVHYYKQCNQGTGFCWRILIWLQWMLYLC